MLGAITGLAAQRLFELHSFLKANKSKLKVGESKVATIFWKEGISIKVSNLGKTLKVEMQDGLTHLPEEDLKPLG